MQRIDIYPPHRHEDFLRRAGRPAPCGARIVPGGVDVAGLSREARVSAREFGALLEYAWRQPYMPEYVASMALSGLDGTLRRKFDDAQLTGRAHLKTGSLDHVSAIAGYLQSRSGRRFSVVMLHNYEGVHRGPGEEAQVALLRWLYEQ